jgi:AraC-like DNA-binding protein
MPSTIRESVLVYMASGPAPDAFGLYPTPVAELSLLRRDRATPLQHAFYEAALIVVVQGSKDLMLGDARFTYEAGQYMVVSVGLPVLASITVASADQPYLAMAFQIDKRMIQELVAGLDSEPAAPTSSHVGLFVGTMNAQQTDAAARIAALLETPDALRVLYPSIARELFYWLLSGPDGAEIRRLAAPDGHTQRIAEAITMLRERFTEGVPIERLAAAAHMSPSSFHHHFKAVTAMSPLQYQKQLRLLEARRLMLANGADATRAAYEVGYESTSQFSREYARMFGAPPRRNISEFRAAV